MLVVPYSGKQGYNADRRLAEDLLSAHNVLQVQRSESDIRSRFRLHLGHSLPEKEWFKASPGTVRRVALAREGWHRETALTNVSSAEQLYGTMLCCFELPVPSDTFSSACSTTLEEALQS